MKSLSSFAVLLLAGGTLAANPVFNGSFELGTDGFALEKELRTDTNPGLKFIPLKVTDQAPGSGKRSLLFENPHAEYYNIFSKEFRSRRLRQRAWTEQESSEFFSASEYPQADQGLRQP